MANNHLSFFELFFFFFFLRSFFSSAASNSLIFCILRGSFLRLTLAFLEGAQVSQQAFYNENKVVWSILTILGQNEWLKTLICHTWFKCTQSLSFQNSDCKTHLFCFSITNMGSSLALAKASFVLKSAALVAISPASCTSPPVPPT